MGGKHWVEGKANRLIQRPEFVTYLLLKFAPHQGTARDILNQLRDGRHQLYLARFAQRIEPYLCALLHYSQILGHFVPFKRFVQNRTSLLVILRPHQKGDIAKRFAQKLIWLHHAQRAVGLLEKDFAVLGANKHGHVLGGQLQGKDRATCVIAMLKQLVTAVAKRQSVPQKGQRTGG